MARRTSAFGRQQIRNGAERRLLIDEQHEELFAHQGLELGQGQPPPVVLDGPQAANGREPALVRTAAARHADIEQAADQALAQTAFADTRLQFSDRETAAS